MDIENFTKLILFGQSFFNKWSLNKYPIKTYKKYLKEYLNIKNSELEDLFSYFLGDLTASQLYAKIKTFNNIPDILKVSSELIAKNDPFDSPIEFIRNYKLSQIYNFGIGCLNVPGIRLYASPLFKVSSFFSINKSCCDDIYVIGTNKIFEIDNLTFPASHIIDEKKVNSAQYKVCTNTRDYAILHSPALEAVVFVVDSRYTFDSLISFQHHECKMIANPDNFYPLRVAVVLRLLTVESEDRTIMDSAREICDYIRAGYAVKPHYFFADLISPKPVSRVHLRDIDKFELLDNVDVFNFTLGGNFKALIIFDKGILKRYIGFKHAKLLSLLDSKFTKIKILLCTEAGEDDEKRKGAVVAVETNDGWMTNIFENVGIGSFASLKGCLLYTSRCV